MIRKHLICSSSNENKKEYLNIPMTLFADKNRSDSISLDHYNGLEL